MTVERARALRLQGRWADALAALDGDESSEALVERVLVLADENLLALHGAFLRDRSQGEPPEEMEPFERALQPRRELGDAHGVAESLFHVGLVHQVVRGDNDVSRPFFAESYERPREIGDELLM